MPEYAFLIGFVVIRSADQRRVSPSGLRRLHMLKRRHGVVRPAPGHYPAPPRSLLPADFSDALPFLNPPARPLPRAPPASTPRPASGHLPAHHAPPTPPPPRTHPHPPPPH